MSSLGFFAPPQPFHSRLKIGSRQGRKTSPNFGKNMDKTPSPARRRKMASRKRLIIRRNTAHHATKQNIHKQYGLMDDGHSPYADALENLRQKVIKNFFTEPDIIEPD